MPVDDDLALEDLETPGAPAASGRRRGFWIVFGAMAFGCVFVVIEIFANVGMKNTIAHAEHSLQVAQAAAERIRELDGSVGAADQVRLSAVEPSLGWAEGDVPSDGLDSVSVATRGDGWGAAVQARPGTCFYLHLEGEDTVLYGVGTVCTGQEALQASDSRW